ncbi:hypothetical protein RUM43_009372, partial [Polyplax serrata]
NGLESTAECTKEEGTTLGFKKWWNSIEDQLERSEGRNWNVLNDQSCQRGCRSFRAAGVENNGPLRAPIKTEEKCHRARGNVNTLKKV